MGFANSLDGVVKLIPQNLKHYPILKYSSSLFTLPNFNRKPTLFLNWLVVSFVIDARENENDCDHIYEALYKNLTEISNNMEDLNYLTYVQIENCSWNDPT